MLVDIRFRAQQLYGELDLGSTFKCGGEYYMKAGNSGAVNTVAVHLRSGTTRIIDYSDYVEPVKLKVVLDN